MNEEFKCCSYSFKTSVHQLEHGESFERLDCAVGHAIRLKLGNNWSINVGEALGGTLCALHHEVTSLLSLVKIESLLLLFVHLVQIRQLTGVVLVFLGQVILNKLV